MMMDVVLLHQQQQHDDQEISKEQQRNKNSTDVTGTSEKIGGLLQQMRAGSGFSTNSFIHLYSYC